MGVRKLTSILHNRLGGEGVPEDWKNSAILAIYKGKGDKMEYSKYRGVRLLNME